MTSVSSWKMPRVCFAVAKAQCYFHSCCPHNKITHLTIFSSSEFSSTTSSSSSSSSSSSPSISSNIKISSLATPSKNIPGEKYSINAKANHQETKNPVHENRGLIVWNHEKSLWKKLLFGSKKFRSVILLNVITVIYASDIAVIKDVEAFTDPAYFSAVRFAVSTVPFLPFIIQARDDAETRNSGVELGLWISVGYLCEALGLLTSDASRASFISLFTVIVIPLLESMVGELVPARTWFGIVMSVVGISMLECSGSPPNIGDLFNFLSAIFFGIHTLRTEHISRTITKDKLLPLLGYQIGVVALLSTIWWLGTEANLDQDSNGVCWLWDSIVSFPWIPALYTGVFSTGFCLWAEIAAMRDVSATETALIYGLEPLWGAAFAWFLLGERWELPGWIGAALIFGGSVMVQIFGGSGKESRGSSESGEKEKESSSNRKKKLEKTVAASPVMVRSSGDKYNNVMDRYK